MMLCSANPLSRVFINDYTNQTMLEGTKRPLSSGDANVRASETSAREVFQVSSLRGEEASARSNEGHCKP